MAFLTQFEVTSLVTSLYTQPKHQNASESRFKIEKVITLAIPHTGEQIASGSKYLTSTVTFTPIRRRAVRGPSTTEDFTTSTCISICMFPTVAILIVSLHFARIFVTVLMCQRK